MSDFVYLYRRGLDLEEHRLKGTIIGEFTNGFILPSGAWCNSTIGRDGAVQAEYYRFREYGKKKVRGILKTSVLRIEPVSDDG